MDELPSISSPRCYASGAQDIPYASNILATLCPHQHVSGRQLTGAWNRAGLERQESSAGATMPLKWMNSAQDTGGWQVLRLHVEMELHDVFRKF